MYIMLQKMHFKHTIVPKKLFENINVYLKTIL